MIQKPIFLVGAERSGTTLLRIMLNHHPKICWVQEFEYSIDLVSDNGKYPSLNYYYDWLETNRIFQSMGFRIDQNLNYPQLVNSFLEQRFTSENKLLIGATVHRHFNRLLSIWPDALFIHIIRDPRDVARSCIGMGWAGNVWYGIDRWIEAEMLWEQMKTKISSQGYIEINYEDLIAEPEKNLTSVCQFLHLNYDASMLDYEKDTTYSKPDAKLIQQWRKKLSDLEIQLVESKTGSLLTQKQYKSSGLPQINVDGFYKKQLSFQNWLYKVKFRINRFGLSLIINDYLSRKLRLKSWQKQNKLKMHEIRKKSLK